jgi:hypothetical protein
MANLVLALMVWGTGFGVLALAWKRRTPLEIALIAAALIMLVAWGGPLAIQS